MLPLNQRALLTRAIGNRLTEIERLLWSGFEEYRGRGGEPEYYFARASGPTQLLFSETVVHQFDVWSSNLSLVVTGESFADDPYAHRVRLSRCSPDRREEWLAGCLGQMVHDVRVHLYQGPEAGPHFPQAAVSYRLDSGVELFYAIYVHGRMDGDELLQSDAILWDKVFRSVSLGNRADPVDP